MHLTAVNVYTTEYLSLSYYDVVHSFAKYLSLYNDFPKRWEILFHITFKKHQLRDAALFRIKTIKVKRMVTYTK